MVLENIKWAFWDKHASQATHAHKFTGKHMNKIFTIHVIIHTMRDRDKCKLATALSLSLIAIVSLRTGKFAHVAIAHVHSLIQASYVHTFKPHI